MRRDDGGRSGLRVRSWTDGRTRFDIVGDPDFGDRYGRVVCLTTSSDPPTMTTRVLPTGATEYWWRWGHAIELARDFDADGAPDAVITAPGVAGGFVSVRSTRTGQHVCSLPIGRGWMIYGTSLGVSADGCYALIGGARPTEPELLDASAEIQLHELLPGREPRVVVWRKSGE